MSTDRIIESAREVARVWKHMQDTRHPHRDTTNEGLLVVLDELVRRCSAPEVVVHRADSWKHVMRGSAENGYQPETEYLWTCICREGHSDDMGESVWAKQAVDKHIADPTQFPGWPS